MMAYVVVSHVAAAKAFTSGGRRVRERFREHLRSICNRSFDLNILTRQITLYKTSRSMAQSSARAETPVTNSICEACSARLDRADYRHQPNFFKPCFTRVVIIRACSFNEVFVWRSSTTSSKIDNDKELACVASVNWEGIGGSRQWE